MNITSINKEFKLEAGMNDAALETTKLLILQYSMSEIDKSELSLSDRTLQYVTPVEPEQIEIFLNNSFIVTTNNIFEITLRKYYDYFKKIGSAFKEKTPEISWLDVVLHNCVSIPANSELIWAKKVCDYYRLTRNYFSHGSVTKQCEILYDELYKLDVPNIYSTHYLPPQKYNSLSYNDCKLFSRVTKDISKWICSNPNYDYNKLLSEISINQFKQVYNAPERCITKIKTYLIKEYGITDINILTQLTDSIFKNMAC